MNNIPKVIHYCWFGGNPLPELDIKCIDSWKKYFPDYEIREWNETNFDLECCDYVKEAYKSKKWAFVSDYARFYILYKYGGLYFDTDVEVIKSFDSILSKGAFMGCEASDKCAPGLGLGCNPGLEIYKEILDFYHTRHFIKEDGSIDTTTVVKYTSDILYKHGWMANGDIEKVSDIYIYPSEYFCPINYNTGKLNITDNTYSIHWYTASWHSKSDSIVTSIGRWCNNHFGNDNKIHRVLDFPFRVYSLNVA